LRLEVDLHLFQGNSHNKLVGGRVVFKECYVCPKVRRVWEKDRSQLILDAVDVAVILIINRNLFVHPAVMALLQK